MQGVETDCFSRKEEEEVQKVCINFPAFFCFSSVLRCFQSKFAVCLDSASVPQGLASVSVLTPSQKCKLKEISECLVLAT